MAKNTMETFWKRVLITPHCWIWTGTLTHYGYATMQLNGRRRVVHRIAYEALEGKIPEKMQLDHMCHNRACVNPSHLRLTTNKQNNEHRKGSSKGNISGYRGVSYHKTKKRWGANVRHNYRLYYLGYYPLYELHVAGYKAMLKRNELFTHNELDRSHI